jgi:hypothetical protein
MQQLGRRSAIRALISGRGFLLQCPQHRRDAGHFSNFVEGTFAWISRNRRLARDFARYATTGCRFHPPRRRRPMLQHRMY